MNEYRPGRNAAGDKEEMMLYRRIVTRLLALLLLGAPVAAQDVNTILSKHIEALGGSDALDAVTTLRLKGTLDLTPAARYNVTISKMRPNLYRYEMEYRGTRVVEAFDGTNVWHICPFDGINSPTLMENEIQVSKIKGEADIISPLVASKDRGYRIEYLGRQMVDGVESLRLKITFPGNYTTEYFLGLNDHLPSQFIRLERHNPRGRANTVTTRISDYRRTGKVLFAHRYEILKGTQKSILTIARIEINPGDVTPDMFAMK
jgi:hypothetical protein